VPVPSPQKEIIYHGVKDNLAVCEFTSLPPERWLRNQKPIPYDQLIEMEGVMRCPRCVRISTEIVEKEKLQKTG
jgi:hypothetical protein